MDIQSDLSGTTIVVILPILIAASNPEIVGERTGTAE
jgi:hypothetical protein